MSVSNDDSIGFRKRTVVIILIIVPAAIISSIVLLAFVFGDSVNSDTFIVCLYGYKLCNGKCVNINSDPANCGYCGKECLISQSCVNKVCYCHWPDTACKMFGNKGTTVCLDTNSNPFNCGGCNQFCPGFCSNGNCIKCKFDSQCLSSHFPICNTKTGTCIQCTAKDFSHCLPGQACVNGFCKLCITSSQCNQGLPQGELCDTTSGECISCPKDKPTACLNSVSNSCVDLQTDNNNCGKCGNACSSTEACISGNCLTSCQSGQIRDPFTHVCRSCPSGTTACFLSCTNTQTDPTNCGTCGNHCSSLVCNNGRCECPAGTHFDTTRNRCECPDGGILGDKTNCGYCGRVCPGESTCSNNNSCNLYCPPGYTDYNNYCVPTGACTQCGPGHPPCPSGTICSPHTNPWKCYPVKDPSNCQCPYEKVESGDCINFRICGDYSVRCPALP